MGGLKAVQIKDHTINSSKNASTKGGEKGKRKKTKTRNGDSRHCFPVHLGMSVDSVIWKTNMIQMATTPRLQNAGVVISVTNIHVVRTADEENTVVVVL